VRGDGVRNIGELALEGGGLSSHGVRGYVERGDGVRNIGELALEGCGVNGEPIGVYEPIGVLGMIFLVFRLTFRLIFLIFFTFRLLFLFFRLLSFITTVEFVVVTTFLNAFMVLRSCPNH